MPGTLVRTDGPAEEPLSRLSAKRHLRVDADDTSQDEVIDAAIVAAREVVENETKRAVITQTWTLTLDEFPSDGAPHAWALARRPYPGASADRLAIRLGRPPIQSITSVTYVDANGATQTLAPSSYVLDPSQLGMLRLAYGASWPATRVQPMAVTITFVSGTEIDDVPKAITAAMKLLVGDLYENREGQIVGTIAADNPTVKRLLAPYVVPEVH